MRTSPPHSDQTTGPPPVAPGSFGPDSSSRFGLHGSVVVPFSHRIPGWPSIGRHPPAFGRCRANFGQCQADVSWGRCSRRSRAKVWSSMGHTLGRLLGPMLTEVVPLLVCRSRANDWSKLGRSRFSDCPELCKVCARAGGALQWQVHRRARHRNGLQSHDVPFGGLA